MILKIGVVLSTYPVPSETFIVSFLSHLEEGELHLFANVRNASALNADWKVKPYLNRMPKLHQSLAWVWGGLKILFYWKRFKGVLSKGVPLKQAIADANIWTTPKLDVLHFPFGNSAFGREHYAELLGAKMTLSFRGSDINVFPIYHQTSYSKLWPFVSAVHCNSIELADKLQEHHIPASIPVSIIHPALRADLLTEPILERGNQSEFLKLVTIGRLHWVKDYPLALRSLALLKNQNIPFHYTIIGGGPEKELLMFLIHELGLQNHVTLAGTKSAKEIALELKNSNIYLQTSLAEGFSNACLEAQAYGLPCVVPNISGMSACIEQNKTGIIVENRAPESFAQAIQTIFNNPDTFPAAYISKRVRQHFTLKKQKEEWLTFFDSCYCSILNR